MTWRPGTPRKALQRATAALKASPARSDALIARQARCGRATVSQARRALEEAGQIAVIPVRRRQRRPYPRQPSATHAAIMAGARTPREVGRRGGRLAAGRLEGAARAPAARGDPGTAAAACAVRGLRQAVHPEAAARRGQAAAVLLARLRCRRGQRAPPDRSP